MTGGERTSFARLPARVGELARGKRIVAFDVFDTLLRRRVVPETIKDIGARRLARLIAGVPACAALPAWGVPDWKLLRERRRTLELDMGREAEHAGDDHEFRLRPMLLRLARESGAGERAAAIAEELARFELDLEARATLPTPAIQVALDAAAAGGRRLIFISDSYLSEEDVRSLLGRHGLLGRFGAGYVSSSYMRTKRSGRLFEIVLEREGVSPSEVLLVGDNPYSDFEAPTRLGIGAVLLHDPREKKRRDRLLLVDQLARRNRYWVGRLERETVETTTARVQADAVARKDPHYRLGVLLAPAFIAFARHVLERAHERGLGRVFFMSREGLTFMKMYRRLARELGGTAPPASYIGVSRQSTFLASVDSLEAGELARIWWQYGGQSIGRVLRNLSLPAEEFGPLALRAGFASLEEPIHDLNRCEPLRAFFEDAEVRERFTVHRDRARRLLSDYLRGKGWYEAERVGIVDIGWKGSIQNNIFRALRGEPGAPAIEGLYFGLIHTGTDESPRNLKHGYMADTRAGDWIQECIFKNGSVFEMFSTAPHGSAEAYREVAPGRVKAVVRPDETEARNFRGSFARVRRGVEDYFEEHLACAPLADAPSAEVRAYILDQLRRYILYPTGAEARAFLEYSHVENFGVYKVSDYGFKGSWRRILAGGPAHKAPRRLLHELRCQFWPEGICRRSRVPLANLLFDLVETRRACRYVPP